MALIPQMTSIRSGWASPAFLLRAFCLVFAIISWVTPLHADQLLNFVWVADTRGDANKDVIDTSVLTPIVNSILALKPAPNVAIFGGDAAYRGGTTNLKAFQTVFTNPLTAAGIPWAFAVGNHELYTTGDSAQYLMRQQDFQAMFNSQWPQNGPSGYNNLAFSFQIGNSRFIIADSFYATSNTTEPSYGISAVQQDWMKGLLQNATASHIFVFTHVPAFSAWAPSQEPDSNMAAAWQTITTAGSATNTDASILFAGHEHVYYRAFRDGTYQVLAGSAGAPMGCDMPPCPTPGPLQPGDVRILSYNYAVVSINGRYVTVSVFDQANNTLDAFQFFDNSGVQNSVINNAASIVGPQPSGILAGSGNTINNSATISNVTTGIDGVSNNIITNSGGITPSSGGNGIYVYDNNTITNTVAGSITGNSADLWGIRVNTGNTVVNHGTVAVSGTNSIAFLAQGDSNTLTNYGTLSASGTNSYAAQFLGNGNILVNSGTISGNVWFSAGDNAFTNNGIFDGSGGLYKVNSGTLTLRGPTSYTGGTYLNGGVINVTQDASLGATSGGLVFGGGTLQLSADITSARNATLNSGGGTFDTNGNALTLSGVISGPGSLTKVGDGTLKVTGVNTYSGATTVNAGTLFVSGSIAYSAATVNAGGTLAGVGTVGPVTVAKGGLFGPGSGAPGSSMSVAGNLVFQPGGVYLVYLNTTSSSLANVSGSATLTGANVLAAVAPGSYLTRQYTILHTTGGLGGTAFGGFGANIPSGFLAGLSYSSNDALLNLTANLGGGTSLLGGELHGNQQSVATALNTYFNAGGGLPPRFVNLFGLSGTNLASALAGLSGEGTSAAQQAVFNSRGQFFDAALSQAALLLDSGPTQYALASVAPIAIPTTTGWRVWAAGFGNGGNLDGLATSPGSAKATFTNGGGSAGADYRVNPKILVGFTAGGAEAAFDVSDRYTHGSAAGVNLGVYGMAMLGGGVYVQGVLSYGYYNNDIRRDLVGENIGPTENARGRFGSNLFGGRFEAGWKNTFGQVNLTPFASIQFDALSQNAYSESTVVNGTTMPGIMGLHYSSHSVTSVPLSLGLQADGSFPVGDGMTITPSARISWVHEFEPTRAINAAFLAAPDFAFGVRGAAAAEDAGRVDAGLSVRFSPQFVLYGNFVGVFSGVGTTVGGLGGLKYSF